MCGVCSILLLDTTLPRRIATPTLFRGITMTTVAALVVWIQMAPVEQGMGAGSPRRERQGNECLAFQRVYLVTVKLLCESVVQGFLDSPRGRPI